MNPKDQKQKTVSKEGKDVTVKTKNGPITVKSVNPDGISILADEIGEVAAAMKKLNDTRLERRAILLLVQDITNLPLKTIDAVLNAVTELEICFLKKK
jgi:hypothetical protein